MLQSQTLDQTQGSLREKGQDAGAPDDGPVELTEELKAAIIKQVEFYCSDANLPSDKNLLKQFRKDANGWVPLKIFANFRKVRALTKDQQQLAESLRASKHIVISDDAKKLRRVVPVPQYDVVEIQRRTIVVESLPCSPTIEGVTAVFQRYGQVNLVRICTKESKGKLPEWLTSAAGAAGLHSSAGGAAVSDTPHAYVEFAREEDAIMAVAALHDTDGWRPLGIEVRHLVFPCSDASERTVPRSDNCAAAKQKQQTSLRRWNSTGGVVDSRSQPMTMGASTKPSPPTAAMRPTGPISHPQQQHRSFTLGGSAAPRCPPMDPPGADRMPNSISSSGVHTDSIPSLAPPPRKGLYVPPARRQLGQAGSTSSAASVQGLAPAATPLPLARSSSLGNAAPTQSSALPDLTPADSAPTCVRAASRPPLVPSLARSSMSAACPSVALCPKEETCDSISSPTTCSSPARSCVMSDTPSHLGAAPGVSTAAPPASERQLAPKFMAAHPLPPCKQSAVPRPRQAAASGRQQAPYLLPHSNRAPIMLVSSASSTSLASQQSAASTASKALPFEICSSASRCDLFVEDSMLGSYIDHILQESHLATNLPLVSIQHQTAMRSPSPSVHSSCNGLDGHGSEQTHHTEDSSKAEADQAADSATEDEELHRFQQALHAASSTLPGRAHIQAQKCRAQAAAAAAVRAAKEAANSASSPHLWRAGVRHGKIEDAPSSHAPPATCASEVALRARPAVATEQACNLVEASSCRTHDASPSSLSCAAASVSDAASVNASEKQPSIVAMNKAAAQSTSGKPVSVPPPAQAAGPGQVLPLDTKTRSTVRHNKDHATWAAATPDSRAMSAAPLSADQSPSSSAKPGPQRVAPLAATATAVHVHIAAGPQPGRGFAGRARRAETPQVQAH
ncbi:hypothetical protein V8C86DRAFT_2913765 [Haematococcus lacustris]